MRKMRLLGSISVLMILGMLLVACGAGTSPASAPSGTTQTGQATQSGQATAPSKEPKRGGTLMVAMDAEPPTLDWATSTTMATRQFGYHVFEMLFTYDDNYEMIPQLADSFTVSADGLVYTIKLRQGIKFHNGDEMEAEDVKASLDRFLAVSPRKGDTAAAKEVRVKDKYTVEIELSQAQGAFLYALAMPVPGAPILPKELIEGVAANKLQTEQLIGTGPFKLVEYIPAQHIKLARFEGYVPDVRFDGPTGLGGKREVYLDEIMLRPVREPVARVAGLEAGDFHFADALPHSEFERLQGNDRLQPEVLKPMWWITMVFNTTTPPFDNVNIRRAVMAALDNEEIMIAVAERPEFYRIDSSLFFQEQVWHNDVGTKMGLYNENNPEKARKMLQDAGYNGEPIRILTNTSYDFMYKASLVAAEQLKAIGMKIDLVVTDWPTATQIRNDFSKWEIYYTAQSPRFDGSGFGYMLHTKNFSGYSNPVMDDLLTQGLKEGDPKKRKAIYDQVHELWYEDVPQLKHGDYFGLQGHAQEVQGYIPWYSIRFWNVWLDK